MAYLTPSRTSRNVPNRDGGIPELPTPPIGGGETGTLNGMNSRIEFQLLIKAAMRACDHHGDGPAARAEMSRQCLATPSHQRADLLDHFRNTYRGQA